VYEVTYVIAEPCVDVKNKSCVDVCPVSCIYIEDESADRMLYINPDECIDCGACEPECPVDAIFESSAVPSDWSTYTEINAQWFQDKDAARARVTELKPA
jgi:ferredoxin